MNNIALNNPRTIRAWCMYDWANSVYSLVITSAIFPVYYQSVTTAADGNDKVHFLGFEVVNSVLYSYALSFSFLVIAPLLPLLSGMADYTGNKKIYMKIFCYTGALACMGFYFFTASTLHWGIFCVIIASIGFSGSLVFYDAFLPEIVTPDLYDKTSAKGFSYGYYGSVLMMVIALGFILSPATFGFPDAGTATRFSFLLVGLWWIGFAQIPFARLPDNPYNQHPGKQKLLKGYYELRKVWNSLKENRDLKFFIAAYFFYNMGVQTVMYLAATFGSKELKLPDFKLIATVLLIQLVASVGANFFARYSERHGNRKALITMIGCWIVICIAAYFIRYEYQFYAVAFAVGLVMGGIQALSRATYSKLIPQDSIQHASYFSFFDVTFNLSVVAGTFCYGLVEQLTGSMRNSTLALASFFVIGLLLLLRVRSAKLLPIRG
ncbi:MAG: MFS transporter [Bacteroidetes bacterium]|nr:MFS transporter [Bacteroidota bacterium]MBS1541613.1 MFS transporter [Bacteroidota bacterium]